MSKLTKYIEDLRKKYGDAIVTKESHYDAFKGT